ncbi:MAG: transcription antitermination protein NusB [Bacteroidetes bacterium]|nr:transcription antitermination protein NusB [Bacteroidota bacterium]
MLNRRFLRIKVMQALYSYFQHEKADKVLFERELFKSIDKIHELYLSILSLFESLHHVALMVTDENKNKRLPTEHDLNPNLSFINNSLLKSLSENKELKAQVEKRRVTWQNDFDVVRRLYNEIKASGLFTEYMSVPNRGIVEDRDFLISIITEYLSQNDVLASLLEEKNIHWADDSFVAYNSVIRNFEAFDGEFKLMPLLKDEKDDMEFMSILFSKTILYRQEFQDLIGKHTQNWEVERIANMDMLLMEMALTEIMHLPNVPIKASLNEYIDISKEYSTPNSNTFLNGVLDKIIAELKQENKIVKTGRGLKDN